ncbi:MAG: prephenate dehydratase domain-containing protein [Candidatus Woesearchaeota archaeon]
MKIGFQGIKGAYSEIAIYKHLSIGNTADADKKNVEIVCFDSFEDVFEAVKNKKIDAGMLPFENTIAGSIAANYDLLVRHGLVIVGEVFLRIQHSLLFNKGTNFENVKTVYSHPVALDQCKEFIRKHNLKAVQVYDTAGAAKMVSERKRIDESAIASNLCAEIYDLDAVDDELAGKIESNVSITKFFIIVLPENAEKSLIGMNKDGVNDKAAPKKEKTCLALKTKHYPGALVDALQRLSKHNVNMTKLESRPIPEASWEYMFFVEIEGGTDDDNIKLVLSEIEATSIFFKVLGSYPKGKL